MIRPRHLLVPLLLASTVAAAAVRTPPVGHIPVPSAGNAPVQLIEPVDEILGASSFRLMSGVEVAVTPATRLNGFSGLDELTVGVLVQVVGELDGATVVALSVTLLDDGNPPPAWIGGIVTEVVADDEVVLDGVVRVRTHPTTVFVGVAGLAELAPGDLVEAEGGWSGDLFVADQVVLVHGGNQPHWFLATVDEVLDGDRFRVEGGIVVLTGPATDLVGFASVGELLPGDLVEVHGQPVPGRPEFAASRVELVQPAGDPITIEDRVAVVVPPLLFVLEGGVEVSVTPTTTWVGIGGLAGLRQGDTVRVTGRPEPSTGRILADEVVWLAGSDPVQVQLDGQVTRIDHDWLVLDGVSTVLVGPDTVLVDLPDLAAVNIGDRLLVDALTTDQPATYLATRLEVLEPATISVDLVATVTAVHPPERFTIDDGSEVRTGPGTTFLEVDGVADLHVGDSVHVVGVRGVDPSDPLAIFADLVERTQGEDPGGGGDDGGGLTTEATGVVTLLLPPDSFVMDSWYTVRTDGDTEWLGTLTAYGDLVEGAVVRIEMVHGDGLVATSVEDLASNPGAVVPVDGTVVAIEGERRFRLDGGERLLVNDLTLLDGDVDTPDEIVVGMRISAEAVPIGGDDYQALTALVEMPPGVPGSPGEPVSQALVVMDADADPAAVAARHGAVLAGTLPGRLVYLLEWADPVGGTELAALLDEPMVETVEPNYRFYDPETDPESVRRRLIVVDRSPTSGEYRGQAAATDLGLADAHRRTVGGGTVVAVIDTGVDPFHPLLRHRLALGGLDFVDGDDSPWETADGVDGDGDGEVDEAAGHGTFVSGLVLLAAPGARILPYRVLDDDGFGSTFDICLAVLDAMDRGVDVINMSFVYRHPARVLDRILMEASRRGIVLVAGAGNGASDQLPFPASDSRVAAVAALAADGALSDFSNHGPAVAVGAPGEQLYSSGPDGTFATWGGTSMAAPLFSGTAALIRSVNPYLAPHEVLAAIRQGAGDPVGDGSPPRLDAAAALALVPDGP